MSPDKPLRYAFYARVSTAMQAERGTIEQQHSAFMDHRKRNGDYTPVKVYEDDGVSGGLPFHKRRAGREMLADAESRMFDVLVVYSISRFARNTLEALSILQRLKEDHGVAFVSLQENYDTSTPAGYFAFTNMAGVFQLEKDTILERTQNGQRALLREGIKPNGMTRYGWRRENPDRYNRRRDEARLVEHEEQAPVVREIFRLFVCHGHGSEAIASLLTARGVATAMNGKRLKQNLPGTWCPTSVRRILHSEEYVTGRIPFNTTRRVKKSGEVVGKSQRPEEEWDWIEAPPLIDRETFDRAQAILADHRRRINRQGSRRYPLRGRFLCLKCQRQGHPRGFGGRTMRRARANGSVSEYSYYACLSCWRHRAKEWCGTPSLHAPELEVEVWGQVRHLLLHCDKFIQKALEEHERRHKSAKAAPSPEEDIEHVNSRLEELKRESQRIRDMVRTGFATQEEAAPDMAKVRAEEGRLKEVQVRLLASSPAAGVGDVRHAAQMTQHWLQKLKDAVAVADQDEALREDVIRALLVRIEVDGPNAEAVYKLFPVPGDCCNLGQNMTVFGSRLQIRQPLLVAT